MSSAVGAFVLTLVIFWAGPFAPQQAAGVTLGKLAAEIAKSAARSLAGEAQPAPVRPSKTIADYLKIAVGALAGLAVICGAAAFVRHEQKRVALSGVALGGLAIGSQLFSWSIVMIAEGTCDHRPHGRPPGQLRGYLRRFPGPVMLRRGAYCRVAGGSGIA